MSPAAASVAQGQTQQFTATGTYSNLSTANITSSVTWSSSVTSTATVSNTAGSQGLATATASGSGATTITATSGLISGAGVLTVTPAVLVSIAVSPTAASVAQGQTQQFTATGVYSNLSSADLTDSVTWSSSITSTATVSNTAGSQGLATATASGSGATTITATSGLISGAGVLTVTPAVLVSIAVSPTAASVAQGQTQQFTATGVYSNLSSADLTDSVTWSSSVTSTATVSNTAGSQGLATATASGSGATTITATSGLISGTAVLTVTPAVLTAITVSPAAASVAQGQIQQFTATGVYSNLSTANITSSVTWSSSVTSTATVSNTAGSQGLATATASGSGATTITATSGLISGAGVLTVTPAVLVSIAVSPTAASVAQGQTQQFTATGVYSNLSSADLTDSVTWSSSITSTATVSNTAGSQGLATATASGSGATTITATSGLISGAGVLTVTPAVLVSIAVSPTAASVAQGQTQQFTATGVYSNLSSADLTDSVTWSSSVTSTATVSNTAGSQGLATATASGSGATTITATSGLISGAGVLTVTPAVLVSIAVSPTAASVAQGQTQQFTATGVYSNLSSADLTDSVTWSSSVTSTATVSNTAGSQGLATATASGSGATTITATDPSSLLNGTGLLTVTAVALPPVTNPPSLTISPTSGKKRTRLQITGSNFTPSEVVTVTYKSGLSNPRRSETVLCTHEADTNGSFTCSGRVPRKRRAGPSGNKTIVATQSSGDEATATFTRQ